MLLSLVYFLMVGLKTLRSDKATFRDPFGLDFPLEVRWWTIHLDQNFDSQKNDKINSETNANSLKSVKITNETSKDSKSYLEEWPHLNYYLHVFYYSWHRNSQFHGKYTYWNSLVLELWNSQGLSTGEIHPPQMTLAPAFTLRCSQDPSIIEAHMKQMCSSLIGVLALSWDSPNSNNNSKPTDDLVPNIPINIYKIYKSEAEKSWNVLLWKYRN